MVWQKVPATPTPSKNPHPGSLTWKKKGLKKPPANITGFVEASEKCKYCLMLKVDYDHMPMNEELTRLKFLCDCGKRIR